MSRLRLPYELTALVFGIVLLLSYQFPGGTGVAAAQPYGEQQFAATSTALPLGHAGRWVTDAHGKVVVLHGENVMNKFPPYYPAAVDFGDKDGRFLAEEGFNAVRLGFFWSEAEPEPGVYNDAYIDQFRSSIQMLQRHGIITLLEAHFDSWGARYGGEGAPEWATFDDGRQDLKSDSLYAQALLNPALQTAYANFLTNHPDKTGIGLIERFSAMWKHVASRMSGTQGLMAFGIFNQPYPGESTFACLASLCPPEWNTLLNRMNSSVTAAIRSADRNTPVTYSDYLPATYGAAVQVDPLPDSKSIFTFASYCVAVILTKEYPACAIQYENTFNQADAYSSANNLPAIVNEFGSTDSPLTLANVAEIADKKKMSWFHWAYYSNDPTILTSGTSDHSPIGLINRGQDKISGANINDAIANAIVRPYPALTAGTPGDWNFDRESGVFTYTWSTAKVDGSGSWPPRSVTEIVLPKRAYPNGYEVSITGGTVVSQPGAQILQIASTVDANTVSIEVKRGPHA